MNIIQSKHNRAVRNNISSEQSKSGGRGPRIDQQIVVGDLIYLISDRNKNSPRDRSLVVSVENEWCSIRKFVGNTLKSNSYRVNTSETYKVPPTTLQLCTPGNPAIGTPGDDEDNPIIDDTPNQIRVPTSPQNIVPIDLPELPPPQQQCTDSSPHYDAQNNASHPPPSVEAPLVATPSPAATVAPQPPTPPEILTRPEPMIVQNTSENDPPRRSTRVRRPPAKLRDYDLSQD